MSLLDISFCSSPQFMAQFWKTVNYWWGNWPPHVSHVSDWCLTASSDDLSVVSIKGSRAAFLALSIVYWGHVPSSLWWMFHCSLVGSYWPYLSDTSLDFLMFTYRISYEICLLGLSPGWIILNHQISQQQYATLPFYGYPHLWRSHIWMMRKLQDKRSRLCLWCAALQGPLPAACAIFATNQ